MVPDGNRLNNMAIFCDATKQYVVSFMEPIVDKDNKIIRSELRRRQFPNPEDALQFVEKSLPNFLFEPYARTFVQMDPLSQSYFVFIRPLLPIRFTCQPQPLQINTKQLFDRAKELSLKSMDLPWLAGLFLVAGQGTDARIQFNLN